MTGNSQNKFELLCQYCKDNNIVIPQPHQSGDEWIYLLDNLSMEQLDAINRIYRDEE